MEKIIQQISLELARKITERYTKGEIFDLGKMAEDILGDCKESAREILQVFLSRINEDIRSDKQFRRGSGLVIKEKDRPRRILTQLGQIDYVRDYYYAKEDGQYSFVLDEMIGVRPYERVDDTLSARLVTLATDMSYARSAKIAAEGTVSRQTVRSKILSCAPLEKEPSEKSREVRELHLYADEDHVHMQKERKRRGKKNCMVPLVTVTEGTQSVSGRRNRTVGTMHFVDEDFNTKHLWESVAGYIGTAYCRPEETEIYVHGDGGAWIRNGLNEYYPKVTYVMDGYHFEKRLRNLAVKFPDRQVKQCIRSAVRNDDRKRTEQYLQDLGSTAPDEKARKAAEEFAIYLLSNWDEIRNLHIDEIPGSCTEGQVSHVLSERFSRDPLGWSSRGLGKLSVLRVYRLNGGTITADAFREDTDRKGSYRGKLEEILKSELAGAKDWSIFEAETPVFDSASATRRMIDGYGKMRYLS